MSLSLVEQVKGKFRITFRELHSYEVIVDEEPDLVKAIALAKAEYEQRPYADEVDAEGYVVDYAELGTEKWREIGVTEAQAEAADVLFTNGWEDEDGA